MQKGFVAVFLPALVVALTPGLSSAQPSSTQTATIALTAADIERLKAELREQLKDELREELREALKDDVKAEIQAEAAQDSTSTVDGWDDTTADDDSWAEEEWKWEEPAKPELNFIEFDGYFRFRYDMFNNMDFGTTYVNTDTFRFPDGDDPGSPAIITGPFAPGFAPPTPLCATDVVVRDDPNTDFDETAPPVDGSPDTNASCANRTDVGDTIGGANMRLRLEPTLNVYEDIKIKMQIDILDNIVLGSTPQTLIQNPNAPISVLSNGQVAPVDGINSVWTDSIRVKQVWAEVMTPLGQLRVGRMPDNFGMATTANDGRGLDQDFGDTVDRILFATKIGDFYIIPAFDWAVTGPTSGVRIQSQGQAFDRDQRDDADQYMLSIVRRDSDEEIERLLENDDYVFNYGIRGSVRFQALDTATFHSGTNVEDQAQQTDILERDAQIWSYIVWLKFMRRNFTFEAEHAGVIGSIGNAAQSGRFSTTTDDINILSFGGSARLEYRLLKNSLRLELLVLVASGDPAPGWGLQPLLEDTRIDRTRQNRNGVWEGPQARDLEDPNRRPNNDDRITNFAFDPDYFVDLIFWRQMVGAVTDALVIRPSVQYNFTEALGARLDIIYSRALFASSTPSGSFIRDYDGISGRSPLGNPDENLGIEGDLKLFYDSAEGLHAWIQYGLFIPFGGLEREVVVENASPMAEDSVGSGVGLRRFARLGTGLAHTLQVLLGITF